MASASDPVLLSRLPAGWTAEPYAASTPHLMIISTPGGASVTIDSAGRTFGLGVDVPRRNANDRYTGRGWFNRLVDDAVKALQDVEVKHG